MVSRKVASLGAGAVAAMMVLPGCGRSEPTASREASPFLGHAHTPKYGGVLVEVGSHEFNLEVLVEPQVGKLTIWTLDAHAEAYVRLNVKTLEVTAKAKDGPEQTLVVQAVGNTATGEVVGNSSQFEGTADWLKGAKAVDGSVKSVTMGDKSFTGLKFHWP